MKKQKIVNKKILLDLIIKEAYELGATSVIKINPSKSLIFDDRVKLLCFSCQKFNKKPCCPPKIPNINYKATLAKYKKGLIIIVDSKFSSKKIFQQARLNSTNKLHGILLNLEKTAFNKGQYFTTSFIGGSCKLCKDKCSQDKCRKPNLMRIPIEATGIDVVKTLEKLGLKIEFPVSKHFNRVGLLLIGKS